MRLLPALILALYFCSCDPAPSADDGPPPGRNHLAGQQSPYLLQHAENPVDWYPWGEAATQRAVNENRLMVVSIGYAACHWCHVMEHESFEDSTVARVMNDHYVSIKVDREERPDIDAVYMSACQLATGKGCGWPLNAIALPDGRPVWAGTYFPREQWLKILEHFAGVMRDEPAKLEEYAAQLADELNRVNTYVPGGAAADELPDGVGERMVQGLLAAADPERGGLGGAPKFPSPGLYEFLLAAGHYDGGAPGAAELVGRTLDAMAAGGIYDHLGGGFARYSVDADWTVPHFEKMLYDNAQLVRLYANAYRATGRADYAAVVRQTLDFVERDLSAPAGGFYASLDADTGGEEGATYVWTADEIRRALPDPATAERFLANYAVVRAPSDEGEVSVLRLAEGGTFAAADLAGAREQLFSLRQRRPQPTRDDKQITAWNGLMISGYVAAYFALGEATYRERARRAAEFIRRELTAPDGRLFRNHRRGTNTVNAFLDDYALLAQAYVDLYQATFDESWLAEARKLVDYADAHFFAVESGLYNYTSDEDPPLASDSRPLADGALPSGNSALARVLYQLGTLTADDALVERARSMAGRVVGGITAETARSYAGWGLLYLELSHPTYEVAIVGERAGAFRDELAADYRPGALYLGGADEGGLALLEGKAVPGATLVYVCLERVCRFPVESVRAATQELAR